MAPSRGTPLLLRIYWSASVVCTSLSLVALGIVARAVRERTRTLGKRSALSLSVCPVLVADAVFSANGVTVDLSPTFARVAAAVEKQK